MGKDANKPSFWTEYALPCWREADGHSHFRDQLSGLVDGEIPTEPGTNKPRLFIYTFSDFMSGTDFALFDDTHFNPPERYEPTATVLKKKFDAFLHVLIPLLRPTDNLDKYSGADDTREMRDLGGMFKLADPVGKATWYLFCVLHKEKLLDPKGIEQYFLAQGTTQSTQASQS